MDIDYFMKKLKKIIKLLLKEFFMFYDILIYIKLCVGEGSFRIIWIIVEFVLVVYLILINV